MKARVKATGEIVRVLLTSNGDYEEFVTHNLYCPDELVFDVTDKDAIYNKGWLNGWNEAVKSKTPKIHPRLKESVNFDVAVEETTKDISDKVVDTIMGGLMVGKSFNLPEGYQFVDENGNVINATKIVLEKKEKDVSLTQEQIDIMVHKSCVLFCKHCGCGIPRETCISLGTCKEHDDYRKHMRTYLEKNKKEYPKGLRECHDLLGGYGTPQFAERRILLGYFECLLTCRDAYWKIAGEEMGLGEPWKPEFGGECYYHISVFNYKVDAKRGLNGLTNCTRNIILAFPTEEMRDAFYENFKELIESVKELL